jgi:hypothetical protein
VKRQKTTGAQVQHLQKQECCRWVHASEQMHCRARHCGGREHAGLGGKHSNANAHTTACWVLGPSALKGGAPGSLHICAVVNSCAHVHTPSLAAPGSAVCSLNHVHPSAVFPHMQPLCLSMHTHSVLHLHLLLVPVPGPLASEALGDILPHFLAHFSSGMPQCVHLILDPLNLAKRKVKS